MVNGGLGSPEVMVELDDIKVFCSLVDSVILFLHTKQQASSWFKMQSDVP